MPALYTVLALGSLLIHANGRFIERHPDLPASAPVTIFTGAAVPSRQKRPVESYATKLAPRQYSGSSGGSGVAVGVGVSGSSGGASNQYTPPDSGSSSDSNSPGGSSNPGSSPPGPGYVSSDSNPAGSSNPGYSPGPGYVSSDSNPGSSGYGTSNPGSSNPGNSGNSSPLCTNYEDPTGDGQYNGESAIPAGCQCSGAPSILPYLSSSAGNCDYTTLPPFTTTTAAPKTTSTLTITDPDGTVFACPTISYMDVGAVTTPIPVCAGSSTAVSTIASMASAWSSAQASASSEALFDQPYCQWQSSGDVLIQWALLIPNWMGTFNYGTADGDLRGSLSGNSACNSYSHYTSLAVGAHNTTLIALFWSDDFCTAWQMTNVIEATTGNAQHTACTPYTAGETEYGPDISNLAADLWEGAEDGEDDGFKKRELDPDLERKIRKAFMSRSHIKAEKAKLKREVWVS